MKNLDLNYQPNLAIREFAVPIGKEWTPRVTGWLLMQVRSGTGYCLRPGSNLELETGSVLLLAGHLPGSIRASQLSELRLFSFSVIPERLNSLLSLTEQQSLRLTPDGEPVFKIMPPDSPVAVKLNALQAERHQGGVLFRLKLLQVFAELFVDAQAPAEIMEFAGEDPDALNRLRSFLQQVPASELLELDFTDLARRTHCTARHLSRIFYKLVGMSFTDKRAELRLARAQELLATGNSKVVQVALESGYNSLSQFNLMFIRRYGMSPGKWRRMHGQGQAQSKGRGETGGLRPGRMKSRLEFAVRNLAFKQSGKRHSIASSSR